MTTIRDHLIVAYAFASYLSHSEMLVRNKGYGYRISCNFAFALGWIGGS